ncbi:MAG: hypothetical protein RMJ36_03355 [Candidatus Calescibacterium sp.]|nr:hypothetical protein [Candidatus Calescibacterium sp.]MDW8132673.1 hypothetical protein [Candidatus Calescibacterium sp.]
MKNKIEKKITDLKELKIIPLNTTVPFVDIILNNDVLILNYSSPNIRMLFKFIEHFISEKKYELLNESLTIICIIPHKVKYYDEYLIDNLPFPIYQTTDTFYLEISKNTLVTNVNNSLEIQTSSNYDLAYLFISKNKIDFSLQNEINVEKEYLKVTEKLNYKIIPINYSERIKDIKMESFRNSNILCILKNVNLYSVVNLYSIGTNYKLVTLKSIKNLTFIKSIGLLTLDHNNILIFLLTIENTIIIQKYNIDNDRLEYLEELKLWNYYEKLKSLDLKKMNINNENIILWDHNTIYVFKHNITANVLTGKKTEISFYNVSGQKSKQTHVPTDGVWKQTIWGNINNTHLNNDDLYVADTEYSQLRKLDLRSGASKSINFKSPDKEREKLKGKISSIYTTFNKTFFIDLDFKKIRYIDNNSKNSVIKTVFYDENINLFSQLFFIESLNSIVYNTDKHVIFIDLYRMETRREIC